MMKAVVVGAGLSGSVASFLLRQKGFHVSIFDTRSHTAGNCFDYKKQNLFIHKYGPHTFHTNNEEVWKFVNTFCNFTPYCHKVEANTSEGRIPIPFNKTSLEILGPKTDNEIIDLVFKGYSQKMWGAPWESLPLSIQNRIVKFRDSYNSCYHEDKYQGIPEFGYTEMIKNMQDGCQVHLGCNSDDWRKQKYDILVYTGKIDEYFNNCFGELTYRSLQTSFKEAVKQDCYQLNECTLKVPHTRTIDYSYINGELLKNGKTIIATEVPEEHISGKNIPFYPKNFLKDSERHKKYIELAKKETNVIFLGRLASYKYLDMDIVVGQAISKIKKLYGQKTR